MGLLLGRAPVVCSAAFARSLISSSNSLHSTLTCESWLQLQMGLAGTVCPHLKCCRLSASARLMVLSASPNAAPSRSFRVSAWQNGLLSFAGGLCKLKLQVSNLQLACKGAAQKKCIQDRPGACRLGAESAALHLDRTAVQTKYQPAHC